MKKKYKGILILLIGLLLILISILIGGVPHKEPSEEKVKKIDSISEYGYHLEYRDTRLMKNVFKSLKKELNNKEINYEKYAEYLSELYVIDLFTLNNKINKYDIPCLDFILPETRDNFSLNIEDSLYKYLQDNSGKNRSDDLTEVKSIEKVNIEKADYEYNNEKYAGYNITLKWDYVTDYGYDNKAIIKVIKKENKLYVVNYEASSVGDVNEESN